MRSGTVKWFNTEKGYGFIVPDDGGSNVFVHITAVQSAGLVTLAENQRIGFEIRPARNGRDAAQDLSLL